MTLIKEMILLQVDTRFQLELWLMIMIVFFRQFAMRNQNYGSGTLTSSEGNSSFDLYFYQLTEKSHPRKLAPSGADGDGEMFPGAPHLLSSLPSLLSLCSQGLRSVSQSVREILRSFWQKISLSGAAVPGIDSKFLPFSSEKWKYFCIILIINLKDYW